MNTEMDKRVEKKIESNRITKLAKVEGKRREAVGRKRRDQLKRDMIRQEYESALDQVSFVTSEFMSKRGTLIREDKKILSAKRAYDYLKRKQQAYVDACKYRWKAYFVFCSLVGSVMMIFSPQVISVAQEVVKNPLMLLPILTLLIGKAFYNVWWGLIFSRIFGESEETKVITATGEEDEIAEVFFDNYEIGKGVIGGAQYISAPEVLDVINIGREQPFNPLQLGWLMKKLGIRKERKGKGVFYLLKEKQND